MPNSEFGKFCPSLARDKRTGQTCPLRLTCKCTLDLSNFPRGVAEERRRGGGEGLPQITNPGCWDGGRTKGFADLQKVLLIILFLGQFLHNNLSL